MLAVLTTISATTAMALPDGMYFLHCNDGVVKITNLVGQVVATGYGGPCKAEQNWTSTFIIINDENGGGIDPSDTYTGSVDEADLDNPLWDITTPQELAEEIINYKMEEGGTITPPTQDEIDAMPTLYITLTPEIE